MQLNCKFSLVSNIIFGTFTTCSDMPKFHQEICIIKDIFIKNGYSESFIDKCVKTFLNKVFIPNRKIQTVEKKQVTIVLHCMGMILTEIKLHKTFKQLLSKVFLHMENYFNFKDKIKHELHSLLVFNFKYDSCNAEYIGKTKQHYWCLTTHREMCYFKLEIQESILIKLLKLVSAIFHHFFIVNQTIALQKI